MPKKKNAHPQGCACEICVERRKIAKAKARAAAQRATDARIVHADAPARLAALMRSAGCPESEIVAAVTRSHAEVERRRANLAHERAAKLASGGRSATLSYQGRSRLAAKAGR